MKKLVIILSIFVVMIACSVLEIGYTSKFFTKTHDMLDELELSMLDNLQNLNNDETLAILENTEKYWKKGKNLALVLGHHAVLRNADEKIVTLGEFLRLGEKADSMVSLKQAQNYIHTLISDNYPNITNLF